MRSRLVWPRFRWWETDQSETEFLILRLLAVLSELCCRLSATRIPNLISDILSELPTGLKAVESTIKFFADSGKMVISLRVYFLCACLCLVKKNNRDSALSSLLRNFDVIMTLCGL